MLPLLFLHLFAVPVPHIPGRFLNVYTLHGSSSSSSSTVLFCSTKLILWSRILFFFACFCVPCVLLMLLVSFLFFFARTRALYASLYENSLCSVSLEEERKKISLNLLLTHNIHYIHFFCSSSLERKVNTENTFDGRGSNFSFTFHSNLILFR